MARLWKCSLLTVEARFAWYDLWVGAYWDRQKRRLHVCPVPMLVLSFERSAKGRDR